MIIILMSSCAFVALIGDLISAQFKSFTLEAALSDNLTHAMIGGITWFATTFKFSSFSYYQISLCVFLSSIIDIDHFIEMRSLKIQVSN